MLPYDPENLTVDEASSINDAFRDVGFKCSNGLQDAIEATGFSGEEISVLDPSFPEKSQAGKIDGPSQGHSRMDKESFETFQDILSGYDLNAIISEQEDEVVIQLKQACFSRVCLSMILCNHSFTGFMAIAIF